MRNFLFSLLLLISSASFAQTTIVCDSFLQTSTCAGGNVVIPFHVTGSFPWGNVFTAELSDVWGNWGNPLVMGTTPLVIGGNGIIFGQIPASANFGFLYRIRIVSSNPMDTSNDSPNTLIVTQVAQLNQIISDPGDSACPGDTITLYALNWASSYLWSTGDTTASIQVTQSGIYSVTTTDALTCESTATDTIVFDPQLCTGINEESRNAGFEIYPNPAHGNVLLNSPSFAGDDWFSIQDVTGRTLMRVAVNNAQTPVDVSGFSSGVYVVTLHSATTSSSLKLVVE